MMMAAGAVCVAVGHLFSAGCAYIDDVDSKYQSLARQWMIGVDFGAVAADLENSEPICR